MSKKSFIANRTIRCIDVDLENCEALQQSVWLSRTQRGERYALKGVPTSRVDVVVVRRVDNSGIPNDHVLIAEIGEKFGKYDGAKRDRICVRYVPRHQAPTECGIVKFDIDGNGIFVTFGQQRQLRYIAFTNKITFDRSQHIEGIVRWHFDRYYRFLDSTDIESAIDQLSEFIAEKGDVTLADTNRAASRILYRHARDRGFRKLTLREQKRLGLSGQWHSEAVYAAAQIAFANGKFHASGTGEFSRRAAGYVLSPGI